MQVYKMPLMGWQLGCRVDIGGCQPSCWLASIVLVAGLSIQSTGQQELFVEGCQPSCQLASITSSSECVTDSDEQIKMIIFGSLLTTFEASIIFWGVWRSSKNWLKPKTTISKFNQIKLVQICSCCYWVVTLQKSRPIGSTCWGLSTSLFTWL